MAKRTQVRPKGKGLVQCLQNYFPTKISKQYHSSPKDTNNYIHIFDAVTNAKGEVGEEIKQAQE